jgi:hypothetical protein
MDIVITIADKHSDALARTYNYNPGSGQTLQQHLEKYHSDRIFDEIKQNISNVEREKFTTANVDAIISKDDVKPGTSDISDVNTEESKL